MTEFERELVRSFNTSFERSRIDGIAYRIKQHRFSSQALDILVDSLNPDYYLGIECKSVSTKKGASALYFTQHFSTDKNGTHQIERIDEFLKKSGRTGFLAVELRRGAGKSRKAYIIKWSELKRRYDDDSVGFTVDELIEFPQISREGTNYVIDPRLWRC